jgi:hypothetical protein
MIGRKTLGEVRAELEAALSKGPTGDGQVAESLRRFLAAGPDTIRTPNQTPLPTGTATVIPETSQPTRFSDPEDAG